MKLSTFLFVVVFVAPVAKGNDEPLEKYPFRCTENGYYPHPTDCTKFYECVEMMKHLVECPPGHAWSADGTRSCHEMKTPCSCGTFNCRNNPTTEQPYSLNNKYYAYCYSIDKENIQPVIVYRCLEENFYFQASESRCSFECKDVKLYADPWYSEYFFNCYKSGGGLAYIREHCTLNRVFDEAVQDCVFP
ncbi:hypothetical protein DMENIID0001_000510 [Sergentomyia squamirostris]